MIVDVRLVRLGGDVPVDHLVLDRPVMFAANPLASGLPIVSTLDDSTRRVARAVGERRRACTRFGDDACVVRRHQRRRGTASRPWTAGTRPRHGAASTAPAGWCRPSGSSRSPRWRPRPDRPRPAARSRPGRRRRASRSRRSCHRRPRCGSPPARAAWSRRTAASDQQALPVLSIETSGALRVTARGGHRHRSREAATGRLEGRLDPQVGAVRASPRGQRVAGRVARDDRARSALAGVRERHRRAPSAGWACASRTGCGSWCRPSASRRRRRSRIRPERPRARTRPALGRKRLPRSRNVGAAVAAAGRANIDASATTSNACQRRAKSLLTAVTPPGLVPLHEAR